MGVVRVFELLPEDYRKTWGSSPVSTLDENLNKFLLAVQAVYKFYRSPY
jgi:hypothetical protein